MTYAIKQALAAFVAIASVFCFLMAANPEDAQAGARDRASERHKNSCEAWCNSNKPRCDRCTMKRGCGAGYKVINSWTGYGDNYYACERRLTREEETQQNFDECWRWCNGNKPRCAKCIAKVGCGSGYKQIEKFGGRGDNVYACERRSNTAEREAECVAWCADNKPRCAKCSKKDGCGAGYKTIKKFKGKGINYFACEDRGHSAKNEQDCKTWCSQHHVSLKGVNGFCSKCQKSSVCPAGYTAIKAWKGKGKNWYACGKKWYLDRKNENDCKRWCNQHEDCASCERYVGCGKGYKQMKSFRGKGHSWFACKDRGGSEENKRRCRAYCFTGAWDNPCVKCSRSPGCGEGYEQLEVFGGEGKNYYACREKVYSRAAGAPLGGSSD